MLITRWCEVIGNEHWSWAIGYASGMNNGAFIFIHSIDECPLRFICYAILRKLFVYKRARVCVCVWVNFELKLMHVDRCSIKAQRKHKYGRKHSLRQLQIRKPICFHSNLFSYFDMIFKLWWQLHEDSFEIVFCP